VPSKESKTWEISEDGFRITIRISRSEASSNTKVGLPQHSKFCIATILLGNLSSLVRAIDASHRRLFELYLCCTKIERAWKKEVSEFSRQNARDEIQSALS